MAKPHNLKSCICSVSFNEDKLRTEDQLEFMTKCRIAGPGNW